MGTLKYAILGLLNRNEMTGYELSKEFENNLYLNSGMQSTARFIRN